MHERADRPVSFSDYWRLVRGNRNFRLLWQAQIVSEIGDWLYAAAVYSLLLQLTGSAKSLALAFITQVLPQCLTWPAAGVINDRLSRRNVMVFADFARALIVITMVLVRARDLIWFLYILLVMETVLWGLFEPARNAVVPNITSGRDTLVANTLASTTWSFNFAVGFSIGGALTAAFGFGGVFVINSLSFILSGLLIRRMQFHEPHLEHHPPFQWRDLANFHPIAEGLRYVNQDARLLATMLVKGGLGTVGANWVLLPVLGERVFPLAFGSTDPRRAAMLGMSALMGARGIGALLGPLISTRIAGQTHSRQRTGILIGFLLASAGYFGLNPARSIAEACLSIIIGHAGSSIVWVFSTTLLQAQTEDRFRGRVFSAEFACMAVMMSLVSGLAGFLIDEGMHPQSVATWIGVIVLGPAFLWWRALRLWRGHRDASTI